MSNGTEPTSPTSNPSKRGSVPLIITGETLIGWEEGSSPPVPTFTPSPPPPPVYKSSNTSAIFHTSGNTAPPHAPPAKWIGFEVAIKFVRLGPKLSPIAAVLVGGYYSYAYFFGSAPVVESALVALGAEPSSESATPSKAAQMVQQTRDVVAASDLRVNFANALADDHPSPPLAPVETAPTPNQVTILDRLTMFEAERSATTTSAAPPRFRPDNIDPIISPVDPSVEFQQWVAELEVRGLRQGELNRIFINDLAIDIAIDIVKRRLDIIFTSLGEADTVLVFKDPTGALVTKTF